MVAEKDLMWLSRLKKKDNKMKVAVIGASNKPHRYSYQAVVLLKENGHEVFPVHQRVKEIKGIRVYSSIQDIGDNIDVVTLYVGAKVSNVLICNSASIVLSL